MTGWAPSRERVEYYSIKTRELRENEDAQWVEARELLAGEGVPPEEAALVSWVDEGLGIDSALVVSRDGRYFDFNVVVPYPRLDDPGDGRITAWRNVPLDEIRTAQALVPDGTHVDPWTQARLIAEVIFEREGQAPDAQ